MSNVDSTACLLLVPLILSGLAGLFLQRRYLQFYQQAGYQKKLLREMIRIDNAYRERFIVYWVVLSIVQLAIYIVSMLSLFLFDLSLKAVSIVSLTIVSMSSFLGALVWRAICKTKENGATQQTTAKDIRLSIASVLVYVVISAICILFITGLLYGTEALSHMVGLIKPRPNFDSIYMFTFIFLVNSQNLFHSHYLLTLASILFRPLESLLEKKKISA